MINLIEDVKLAFENMKRRRLRSFLTILAIVVGMSTVVMFITLGVGMQTHIYEQFQSMGSDKIFISPSTSIYSFGGGTSKLTEDDKEQIEKTYGVGKVIGAVYGVTRVVYDDQQIYTFLIGVPEDSIKIFETSQGFSLEQGRYPKESEDNKIAVGYLFVHGKLFDKPVKVGKDIEVEGKKFDVVGSLTQIGNPADDSQIYVPIEVARDMLNKQNEYDFLIAQSNPGTDTSLVAEAIKKDLRNFRDLDAGNEDFSVETSEQIIEAFNSVLGVLFVGVIGIASISLLVGGVGIMNTMFTSVLDRTQEIGVMKAIGATNEDILAIFIIESGFLGLLGGFIGVITGLIFAYAAEYIAITILLTDLISVYLDPMMLIAILLFSFIVGAISGLIPAKRAADMKPVDALRYE